MSYASYTPGVKLIMLHLGLMKLSEENKDIWTAEDEATF
jgi:hypothetical protein